MKTERLAKYSLTIRLNHMWYVFLLSKINLIIPLAIMIHTHGNYDGSYSLFIQNMDGQWEIQIGSVRGTKGKKEMARGDSKHTGK